MCLLLGKCTVAEYRSISSLQRFLAVCYSSSILVNVNTVDGPKAFHSSTVNNHNEAVLFSASHVL